MNSIVPMTTFIQWLKKSHPTEFQKTKENVDEIVINIPINSIPDLIKFNNKTKLQDKIQVMKQNRSRKN